MNIKNSAEVVGLTFATSVLHYHSIWGKGPAGCLQDNILFGLF